MKIDKKKLIELLADKTGMEKPEIESQLKELIQRIIDAAERGKALEIKEFGLFYFDVDGDLKFDPSKELSTEINFKYAGMDPIELSSARRTPEAADEESSETVTEPEPEEETELKKEPEEEKEEPESAAESTKKTEPESEAKDEKTPEEKGEKNEPEKSEEQDKEEPVEASDDEETEPFEDYAPREDDPFGGLLGDASKKMSETEEEDEEPVKPEPNQEKKPAAAKKQDKKASKPVVKKKKKMDPAMIIIGVIIVFVLLIGGYFIIANMSSSQSGNGGATEDQTASAGTSMPEQIDAPAVTPEVVEPEEEEEVLNDAASARAENSEESNDQPTYGLTGRLVDTANNGFSIVVHSLRREANAREVAASLSEEGYRVLVSSRSVSGETVWRVGLGQFSTIADAQEAAQELPEPLSTNNFIQRIQTN